VELSHKRVSRAYKTERAIDESISLLTETAPAVGCIEVFGGLFLIWKSIRW